MLKTIIKEVDNHSECREFVEFPMYLYRDSENFVPPLIAEELEIWDTAKNPALQNSDFRLYLAVRDGQTVGRIAVIAANGEDKIRFGWFDFIDDPEVSKALLQKAALFAQEKNAVKLEGPMGFTNLDKAGMLTKGFDRLATMIGIYNFPYYPKHMAQHGFAKDKEWVEYEIVFPEVLPEKVEKFSEIIKEKYGLKVLKFKSKKELLPLVEPMFDLLAETYKGLSTYTPITPEQVKVYKEKYFGFINKDFVICIEDSQHELIAFAITMPSYSKALQKAKGKLFPFGWWHFLRAGKVNDRANFYLIGIHPDYQKRGVTAIIFKEIYETFRKKGVKSLETNPELAENKDIQLLWQDYNPQNHKRRCTYSINIQDWKHSS